MAALGAAALAVASVMLAIARVGTVDALLGLTPLLVAPPLLVLGLGPSAKAAPASAAAPVVEKEAPRAAGAEPVAVPVDAPPAEITTPVNDDSA